LEAGAIGRLCLRRGKQCPDPQDDPYGPAPHPQLLVLLRVGVVTHLQRLQRRDLL
jgi:hypothetical protein